jgi:phosphate butyryltransferase
MIKKFLEFESQLKKNEKKTIAVALAEDKDILLALEKARSHGLTQAILIGNRDKISNLLDNHNISADNYEIISAMNEIDAVELAIDSVRNNRAQVLMKGLCSTSNFLKGILDKSTGLRSGRVLSHLAVFESPYYPKLFMMSDAAMNIAPDLNTKIAIVENAIQTAKNLGYNNPKVAIISAIEKVNPEAIPSTADAAIISKMAERGQIKGAMIDGPLAVDNALSAESCKVKGIISPVGGDADICIVPNIETGNTFYKLLTILGNAKVAGIVVGAKTPIVLTSRADSEESKYLSIITALKAS